MLKLEIVGLILLAIFAGALIPVQTRYNAELARGLKSPILASLMVFVSGTLGLARVALVSRAALPTAEAAAGVPFTAWFAGGALAATYVVILVLRRRSSAPGRPSPSSSSARSSPPSRSTISAFSNSRSTL